MITDLNDVWLQIIIDNGEDEIKAQSAKLKALTDKADSLRCAMAVRTNSCGGSKLNNMVAFWSLFVGEEQEEKRCVRMAAAVVKAKSELLQLQGLSSSCGMSSSSTTANTKDRDSDRDSDCGIQVQGLKDGQGFRPGEPIEPRSEPRPDGKTPVAAAAAAVAAI